MVGLGLGSVERAREPNIMDGRSARLRKGQAPR